MVAFNYSTMQMTAKVVYYGPGLGGKTTNLQYIYNHTNNTSRGEMVLLETEADRTLFFDLLPLEVGSVGGFKTRIQLYTVPGQVFYNTTRKLVLKGVDGVVFVADSQRPMLQANVDSFRNLESNLAELNLTPATVPLVLQYNKRDLPDVCTTEEMDEAINAAGWPRFEASALTGEGVFETLKAISKLTLLNLRRRLDQGKPDSRARAGRVPAPGSVAAPTPAPAAAGGGSGGRGETGGQTPEATGAGGGAGEAEPAPVAAAPESAGRRRDSDVLAEFERIRQEALAPARRRTRRNGSREISRDIRLTLTRSEMERARRFVLSLRAEDDANQPVDIIRDLQMELDSDQPPEKLLLRLNIALDAEE